MNALTFNITVPIWLRARLAAAVTGRSAYWGKAGAVRLVDVTQPQTPGPGWVVCRTRLGGICGTDLGTVQMHRRANSVLPGFSSMPMILGHENVAEVVRSHCDQDAGWIGKRVCVEPTLSCTPRGIDPPCRRCAVGEFGACENFGAAGRGRYVLPAGTSIGYNSRTGGSWGEFFCAHVSQLVEVPDELTDEQAVLTDPLACSLHGVFRIDLTPVRTVCVFGGGILGLGTVATLRALGYDGDIDIVARHAFQAELARRLGATHVWTERESRDLPKIARRIGGDVVTAHFGGAALTGGYDAVFECTGSVSGLNYALKFTRARGQVVLIGTTEGSGADLTPIWFGELQVVGAYGRQLEHWNGRTMETYRIIHEMMVEGKLPTDGLLTHTSRLSDFAKTFAAATDKKHSKCVKAAFRFV